MRTLAKLKTIRHGLVSSIFVIGLSIPAFSQYSLNTLIDSATQNYPGLNQRILNSEIKDNGNSGLSKRFLPQFNLTAQGSWQSDVTSLPISLPNVKIPEMPKDSWKAQLEIQQLIYDGGNIQNQKDLLNVQNLLDDNVLAGDLWQLTSQVTDQYYSYFILISANEQLLATRMVLNERKKIYLTSLKYGSTSEEEGLILDAEVLKIDQQMEENSSTNDGILRTLEILTGLHSISLARPAVDIALQPDVNIQNNRPELARFSLMQQRLDLNIKNRQAIKLPQLGAFVQTGYGRPSLNMLNTEFDFYAMVGIKASWNLFDWGIVRKDKAVLSVQKEIISSQREVYNQKINSQSEQLKSDAKKYSDLILLDNQQIELRERIAKIATLRFDEGVMNAADLVARLNDVTIAKIQHQLHLIRLQQTIVKYNQLFGQK
ncbi:MAG: TolC family protein [Sphingobacteriia bacterium]|nr:TolC family protein [Sphingobacteriia bacterium]